MAPQIVLEDAGLEYETVTIDTRTGESRAPSFVAVNPAGYVPALVTDDGLVLYSS
jgi:glutathione S-transferase